jgi:hypothetical protein
MNNNTIAIAITPWINEITAQFDRSAPLNKRCTEGARVTRKAATTNTINQITVINPIRDVIVK